MSEVQAAVDRRRVERAVEAVEVVDPDVDAAAVDSDAAVDRRAVDRQVADRQLTSTSGVSAVDRDAAVDGDAREVALESIDLQAPADDRPRRGRAPSRAGWCSGCLRARGMAPGEQCGGCECNQKRQWTLHHRLLRSKSLSRESSRRRLRKRSDRRALECVCNCLIAAHRTSFGQRGPERFVVQRLLNRGDRLLVNRALERFPEEKALVDQGL